MKTPNTNQRIKDTVLSLLALVDESPFELDRCICIGDRKQAELHMGEFGEDRVGFEAFVNHVHVSDIFATGAKRLGGDRELVEQLARTIIRVWADRIRPLLRGRSVLFYMGGREDVAIRFHVERPGVAPWVDLVGRAFLASEHLHVFRVTGDGLEELA
jgi:hypothetical protein